ncbi:MAG: hypothetical protein ACRDGW_03120, partial [Actinomycetota bacterium]
MLVEEPRPALVAQPGGGLGRADDVGEQQRGQDPVDRRDRRRAGEELLDLVEEVVGVARPVGMALARQLALPSSRKVLGEVASVLDPRDRIAAAVQDEHRALDGRQ